MLLEIDEEAFNILVNDYESSPLKKLNTLTITS